MREVTFAEAIREAIAEEMRRDSAVFCIGEDIGIYGGAFGHMKGLWEEFGAKRIVETPISEQAISGAAYGAAITGMRPVAEIMYSDFSLLALDQIVNQAAKAGYIFGGQIKAPLVIKTACGCRGGQGPQHSQCFEAIFAHIPGLKVAFPCTCEDAKGLMKTAIRDDNPVIFLEHKGMYKSKGAIPEGEYTIPFGKADVKREGKDLTVVTYGQTCLYCLKAAERIREDTGCEVEVIDIRTMLPLDTETIIGSVKKTHRALIAHEAVQFAGFGAELASAIADSEAFFYLDAPIRRVGAYFLPVAKAIEYENAMIPSVNRIYGEMKAMLA